MKWLRKIYFGKKAKKRRNFLLRTVENRQALPYLYLLVLSSGLLIQESKRELALYHSLDFMRSRKDSDDIIVGIALGKAEGHQIIRELLQEVLKKTGGVDLITYLDNIGSLE